MELIKKLKSLFNVDSIVELKKNSTYGFSINWLKATKENPYHIIFTSGLSDTKQKGTAQYPEFEFIELYFCLPEYWKVEDVSSDLKWPIEWLNKLAQIPQKNSTWFGPGDTIPTGNPPEAISAKFKQNHFILAEPITFETHLKEVNINDKLVRFLSIIPIFEAEMTHKTNHSAKILMANYKHRNLTEELDEYRTSIIKNRKINSFKMVIIGLCLAVGLTILFKLIL